MTLGDALGPQGKRPELYGIGGWLAFLCVTLLILTPIALVTELIVTLAAQTMDAAEKGFIIAVDIAVGAFTVFTGLGLVRTWRNALRIAKWYFFISIGLPGLATAAFFLARSGDAIGGGVDGAMAYRLRRMARLSLSVGARAEHLFRGSCRERRRGV